MKKFISVILTIALCVGALSVCVFAADKTVYLVLGDSIAYGSGLANPTQACYGRIVADTNDYEYINYAVPGHTTTNLIGRLAEPEVVEAVKKADIISISIGGNDFLLGNLIELIFNAMVLNDYSNFDAIANGFYNNLDIIIDTINANNEDAVILMQTLYNPQSGYLRDPYQKAADRLNAEIERYAKENPDEIVIVDVGTALGDDLDNYAADDIHPSAKGNEIIASETLAVLAVLGLGSDAPAVITTPGEDIDIPIFFTAFLDVYATVFHYLGLIYSLISGILV
ncbi:MAG: hypothetical protein IKJ69_01775 [Clostridia bacterium]|nr:hypothetical protein [Clostridia bacterium]